MQSCVDKIVQEHSIDTTTYHLICKSSVRKLLIIVISTASLQGRFFELPSKVKKKKNVFEAV